MPQTTTTTTNWINPEERKPDAHKLVEILPHDSETPVQALYDIKFELFWYKGRLYLPAFWREFMTS